VDEVLVQRISSSTCSSSKSTRGHAHQVSLCNDVLVEQVWSSNESGQRVNVARRTSLVNETTTTCSSNESTWSSSSSGRRPMSSRRHCRWGQNPLVLAIGWVSNCGSLKTTEDVPRGWVVGAPPTQPIPLSRPPLPRRFVEPSCCRRR